MGSICTSKKMTSIPSRAKHQQKQEVACTRARGRRLANAISLGGTPSGATTALRSAPLTSHTPLLLTTPTRHLPNPLPHSGVTDTHIPYQKRRLLLRLLLRLPALVRTLGSRALAGRRRRAPDTLSRRGSPAGSPEGRHSRRRHPRGGRSQALRHFRPPVSSQDNLQPGSPPQVQSLSAPGDDVTKPTWPATPPSELGPTPQGGQRLSMRRLSGERECEAKPLASSELLQFPESCAFGIAVGV
ncbi:uncharacterized protein LOC110259431 [Sus scrofa]|uniref:uncharacterized protein LOC110259431 n=1 Tax=Sus scrofa TaxID=9823 RepID=UPI000A2B15E8|nr:uncharacterized protein LOC110259431 [Sus scrofa]